jgi:hypothetical protein
MIDNNLRSQIFGMNMQELAELNGLICDTMRRLQRTAARSFRMGDLVSFVDRNGRTLSGTVIKVNQKTVSVRSGNTTWRVTGSLLKLKVPADLVG